MGIGMGKFAGQKCYYYIKVFAVLSVNHVGVSLCSGFCVLYIFRTVRAVWRQTSLGSSYGRRPEPSPPLSSGR